MTDWTREQEIRASGRMATQPTPSPNSSRAEALALRLEAGANALAEFAATFSDADWQKPISPGGGKIGVVVHHVANFCPIEIQVAQAIRRHHVKSKPSAISAKTPPKPLPRWAFPDAPLDTAAPIGRKGAAPPTAQLVLKDYAVRHSDHHLAMIPAAVGKEVTVRSRPYPEVAAPDAMTVAAPRLRSTA